MLIEQIENETLVRISNEMLNRTEVQIFMAFLKENTSAPSLKKTKKVRDQFDELFQKWQAETALLSSGTAIVSHTAYTQINGITTSPIPIICV